MDKQKTLDRPGRAGSEEQGKKGGQKFPGSVMWIQFQKILPAFALFLLLGATSPSMEFQEATLSSGMKVILEQNHASPLISVVIVVGVGSSRETPETSGLSHLLEHLLFDGTATQTREQIKNRFDDKGIYVNAYTRQDYTAFIITSPKEFIEDALKNQADMLLESILPLQELEKERNVVIEEMTKDRDNPVTLAEEWFTQTVLKGTPYERPIIGYENVIRTVSRDEVLRFYRQFYVPENMTAIVVGDFEPTEIIRLLNAIYGGWTSSMIPPVSFKDWKPAGGVFEREAGTSSILVKVGMPAPKPGTDDALAFDLIASYLGGLNSPLGPLLKAEKSPLVTDYSVAYQIQRYLGYLEISATLTDKEKVAPFLSGLQQGFKQLASQGVPEEELKKIQRSIQVNLAFQTENYTYEAMALAHSVGTGTWMAPQAYVERILQVTPAKIKQVAKKYFSSPVLTTAILAPAKEEKTSTPTPAFSIQKKVLENGAVVIAKQNPGSPIFAVHVLVKNRLALEPSGKNGLSFLVQQLLDKGTTTRSAKQISEVMEEISARLKTVDNPYIPFDDYYNSRNYAYIRFETLKEHQEKGLNILMDMLLHPTFPDEEVNKAKVSTQMLLRQFQKDARKVSEGILASLLSPDSPDGKPLEGTLETLNSITRQDLLDYHTIAFAPNNLIFSIVGDFSPESAIRAVEKSMKNFVPAIVPISTRQQTSAGKTVTQWVDKDQAVLYVGRNIVGPNDPDAPALKVLSLVLSSRLANHLREEKGLAYSIGAGVDFSPDGGKFIISIGTLSEQVRVARQGIFDEMQNLLKNPPDSLEIQREINRYWGQHLRYHMSSINQAFYLGYYEFIGVGYEYDFRHIENLRKLSTGDIQNVVKKYFSDPNEWFVAIAGRVQPD